MQKTLLRLATPFNITLLIACGLFIAGYSAFTWWDKSYSSKENVFWGAINQSLSSNGVSIYSDAGSSNGSQTRSISRLVFNGEPSVEETLTTLDNIAMSDVEGSEDIDSFMRKQYGFTDATYVQFPKLDLANPEQQSVVEDAVGVWAYEERLSTDIQLVPASLLQTQSVFFANFDKDTRAELVNLLRDNVYTVDTAKAAPTIVDGRDAFVYSVEVNRNELNKATIVYLKSLGFTDLAKEAESFDNDTQLPSINFQITIDKRSRNILAIQTGSDQITLTGHDIKTEIVRPEETIDISKLEQLLNE